MDQSDIFRKRRLEAFLDDSDELMILDGFIFDSDEESESEEGPGGSKPEKKPNINRQRQLYQNILFDDYFSANPTF